MRASELVAAILGHEMPPRRDRIVLWAFALLVLVWILADATRLLYVAPALGLAQPPLLGRFQGEDKLPGLARAARASPRGRRPRPGAAQLRAGDAARGRLAATALAKRPPPPPARSLAST